MFDLVIILKLTVLRVHCKVIMMSFTNLINSEHSGGANWFLIMRTGAYLC